MSTLREQLETLADAIPGYTTKTDARLTGCSVHFKFEHKVDVLTSLEFAHVAEMAVPKLLALVAIVERVQLAKDDGETTPERRALALEFWDGAS